MTGSLTLGTAPGVAADRWARTWTERRPEVLRVVLLPDGVVGAALVEGVDVVLARLPITDVDPASLHRIPLWTETPVVVAARDHPVRAFDAVRLADLQGEDRRDDLDLVAAGHGVALMPQAVFRATGRRDLVARPVTDAEPTAVELVWPREAGGPLVDEFVGIVRGRTANSSRGAAAPADPQPAPPPAGRRRRPAGRRPTRRR